MHTAKNMSGIKINTITLAKIKKLSKAGND